MKSITFLNFPCNLISLQLFNMLDNNKMWIWLLGCMKTEHYDTAFHMVRIP